MAQTRPSPTLSRGFTRLGRFLAPYEVPSGGNCSVLAQNGHSRASMRKQQ